MIGWPRGERSLPGPTNLTVAVIRLDPLRGTGFSPGRLDGRWVSPSTCDPGLYPARYSRPTSSKARTPRGPGDARRPLTRLHHPERRVPKKVGKLWPQFSVLEMTEKNAD